MKANGMYSVEVEQAIKAVIAKGGYRVYRCLRLKDGVKARGMRARTYRQAVARLQQLEESGQGTCVAPDLADVAFEIRKVPSGWAVYARDPKTV